jgi:hypothetical protein
MFEKATKSKRKYSLLSTTLWLSWQVLDFDPMNRTQPVKEKC